MFPESYHRSVFVAEHGSWDRSSYIGYRVVNLGVDPNGTTFRHDLFASGWLQDAAAQQYFGDPLVYGANMICSSSLQGPADANSNIPATA